MSLMLLLAVLSVNFNEATVPVRPALHSSGFGPLVCSCPMGSIGDFKAAVDDIRSMGFAAARTHDWAIVNASQRVCDYFFIFPLMHLDAKDPRNYFFGPTDYLLKRTREETGLDVFYRLGTSIEHSGDKVHFNALVPEDFEKVAEIFAGTVRHYNRGWADGHTWGIKYWEIWNEPESYINMWCRPGNTSYFEYRELYCKFFVTCLKRLKGEFPDIKVGGPALWRMNEDYFRYLFGECRKAGVKPDFISWHHYEEDPSIIAEATRLARKICDESGLEDCELIINEWHYLCHEDYGWKGYKTTDPVKRRKLYEGPRGLVNIDSSCYNIAVLSQMQTSKLDQAYYYGCGHTGNWGYRDDYCRKYKIYYGLKMFGDFLKGYPQLCASEGEDPPKSPVTTVLAGRSLDGKRRAILVSDYRMRRERLDIDVLGVPPGAKVTAHVHDHTHDFAPVEAAFADGKLTLRKSDAESAAFLVEFE